MQNTNSIKYYKQLSVSFPTQNEAASEIIKLSAILNLPKGTEHFISDIHGEYDSFQHVLKNASGAIARKVDEEFGDQLSVEEKRTLCTLIYYPNEKLELIEREEVNFSEYCKSVLLNLIRVARRSASKYSRTKLKKAIATEYEYIVEELLTVRPDVADKEAYYNGILNTIIETESAKQYIIVFCRLIQHLAVDRLHVLGDIFDRGTGAEMVMETLCRYHSVDIEWGNHDIDWMGAACGSYICIASVIRLVMKYGNLKTLEIGYGINLIPLITLALTNYENGDNSRFKIEWGTADDKKIFTLVHKAITVILLKLEGQLAKKHPEFGMENRRILENIDFDKGTVVINGREYALSDNFFPTIDKNDVYALTDEEQYVMEELKQSFVASERLQRHIEFLYNRGSIYRIYNGNLLLHGCIPFTDDGEFISVELNGKKVKGKALLDELESWARKARYSKDKNEKEYGKDVMYYMWSCSSSPLFGKEKMAVFESYFISDSKVRMEKKNSYYVFYDDREKVKKIFEDFGLDESCAHIINGHVPVKVKDGQTPVHCDGKVIVIDGGFSKVYQKVTGIAGYTLVFNSWGLSLIAHMPFVSVQEAITAEKDIHSVSEVVDKSEKRRLNKDTDKGREMSERIEDLKQLIVYYKQGIVREHQI